MAGPSKSSTKKSTTTTTTTVRRATQYPAKRPPSGDRKVVVRRSNSTTNNKKKTKKNDTDETESTPFPIPTLPPSWHVATCPPIIPPDASALPPGSLLQDKCSGQDVHLAKSAVATPSIVKERGKFLLLFPGSFSFHKPLVKVAKPMVDKETDDNKADIDDDDNDDNHNNDYGGDGDRNNQDGNVDNGDSKPAAVATSKKAPPMSLGKLEGLATDTPSFRIPFANKQLVFPGKKVSTTSKYILLSCANKQKMAVQCKAIFSSAIVFDTPKWEPLGHSTRIISDAIIADDKNDVDVSSSSSSSSPSSTKQPLAHYGGSDRTVDGIARGQKKRNSVDGSTSHRPIPIISQQSNDQNNIEKTTSIFGFPESEEKKYSTSKHSPVSSNNKNSNNKKKPVAATNTKHDAPPLNLEPSSDGNDDDNSDSDESFGLSLPKSAASSAAMSVTKTRQAPKRQASLKRKRYTADDEDEDNDDDDAKSSSSAESEVREVEPPPPKRSRTVAAKQSATVKPKAVTAKRESKKPIGTAKKHVVVVDLLESSSDEKLDKKLSRVNRNLSKDGKPSSLERKTSKGKQTVLTIDSDADGSIDSDNDQTTKTTRNTKENAKQPSRRGNKKSAQKKTSISDDFSDSDQSAIRSNSTNSGAGKVDRRRKPAQRNGSTQAKKKAGSSNDTNDVDEMVDVADGAIDVHARLKVRSQQLGSESPDTKANGQGGENNNTVSSTTKISTPNSITQSPSSKSPFRRRRKKNNMTGIGSPSLAKVLDLTGADDEFTFG
ncbi:hypothetical protein IV203_021998 [Nitzschia inconspicua]|uniref:Uncharacterized protein n=1 Tax=Nitzschia inconspicua TaxID=303405 RepID=A0A9K3PEC4_9STRA|nr:hypothetical protein IV203_021998 [Nitzschia inconspicua]